MKTEELLLAAGAIYLLTRPKEAAAATAPGGGTSEEGPAPGDTVAAPRGGGKGKGGKGKRPAGGKGKTPAGGNALAPTTASTSAEADARIKGMRARAYQARAQAWIPVLVRAGASQGEAEGLARWIGLESSGDPLKASPIGERGLLQCTKTTANMKGGVFTPAEWAMLASKATDRETHARLAIKQFRWHVKRAKVSPNAPTVDRLWYAKIHHQRPADLRVSPARPDAKTGATLAAANIKTPREGVRLAAANMVAFGNVSPP